MNQATKRLFAIVLALVLCFHFAWIVVYCLPKSGKNPKIELISSLYVYPVFQQNWNLFVPAPNAERKLFVRYKTNNKFTDWEDILSREIINHKQNRLLGNEARVLLLSNSLIYALNSRDGKPSSISISLGKGPNKEFQVLMFEVGQYLKLEYEVKNGTGYEMMLVSCCTEKSIAYYLPWLSVN